MKTTPLASTCYVFLRSKNSFYPTFPLSYCIILCQSFVVKLLTEVTHLIYLQFFPHPFMNTSIRILLLSGPRLFLSMSPVALEPPDVLEVLLFCSFPPPWTPTFQDHISCSPQSLLLAPSGTGLSPWFPSVHTHFNRGSPPPHSCPSTLVSSSYVQP